MTKPQQPELRRSGKGATDQDSAQLKPDLDSSGRNADGGGGLGPVPPGNRAGWQDRGEQPVKQKD